jgi:hypothetical protein
MSSSFLTTKAVAAWFHTRGRDGWSPALTLRDVLDLCLGTLEDRRISLTIDLASLRRLFCQALCVLYQGSPRSRRLAFRRPPPQHALPEGWTEDHEALWGLYLDTEFSDWSSVLADVGKCAWEIDLPGWRDTITSLFRYYLVREERLLIEAGLLFDEEEEGEDS